MNETLFYKSVKSELQGLNTGIGLMCVYFLFEFGSIQALFGFITGMRLPLVLALCCIIYTSMVFINGRVDASDWISRLFIIFCFFMILHSYFSTIIAQSGQQNIKLFLTFMINYLLIVAVVKKPHQYTLLIDVWLLAIAHSCFHAIMQGGKIWGSQWLKDENQISAMLVTAIPFAFFMLLNNESKIKKIFYAGCLTTFTAVIVISFSRGGFVALLAVSFFCWLATERKVLSIVIITAATTGVFYLAPPEFFDEMETIKEGTEESTAGARIYQWNLATQMFFDHSIVGIGPLNYPHRFSEYDQRNKNKYFIGRKLVLHSTPFTFLSETGFVGTSIIIILQILLFRNWRITTSFKKNLRDRPDAKFFIALGHASAVSIIGFWVASIFLHLVPFPFYWILIPFSEAVKRLKVQYVLKMEKEEQNNLES